MALIYRWTTVAKTVSALRSDGVALPRWKHFLETEQRFAQGSSWSLDPLRWRQDNPVCLMLDTHGLPNLIHSIAGSRTYWLTLAKTDRNADPEAYKLESELIDEEFIEGRIRNLRQYLTAIHLTVPDRGMARLADEYGIAVIDDLPALGRPQP